MATFISLSEDDIDDILYFARTGETADLKSTLEALAQSSNHTPSDVLRAAIDGESENNPLHMAGANGHLETIRSVLEILSSSAKDLINKPNKQGSNALHYTAVNGHLECVKLLMEKGGDPLLQNKAGHDAIYEAERADKEAIVTYLIEATSEEGLQSQRNGINGSEEGRAEPGVEVERDSDEDEPVREEVEKLHLQDSEST